MRTRSQIQRGAKQLYRLCLVDGFLDDERVLQVVKQLIVGKKRGSAALLAQFQRLVRLDREAHTANIETAVALPADLRTNVEERVKKIYGPRVDMQFAQKPALIGGMRIKVGSDVYDGSVQSELESLEKSL